MPVVFKTNRGIMSHTIKLQYIEIEDGIAKATVICDAIVDQDIV